jgi:two-component system nitrogen regulation sensor histidine kinase NtrY
LDSPILREMKIRWQLSLLFGFIFIVLAILVLRLFKDNYLYLIGSEVALLLLLIVFIWIIGSITKPLNQIAQGIDALKDQDFSSFMRPSGSKEIDRLVTVYNQMLGNIQNERIFQQEQHFFMHNLIESLPVGLIILDFDNKLKEYNPLARDILGIQETDKGKALTETGLLLHKEILLQELREPKTYKISGTRYLRILVDQFKHRGFYQKFVILEEAGDEILKVEKQSYGKVIRMMAHEVKNSVGAINSIVESLIQAKDLSEEDRTEYLEIVAERNTRLNIFVENFAKVVRLPLPTKELFDFSGTVESVYHLMNLKFKDRPVYFTFSSPQETVYLKGSQEQMEQVLINIILNAFEAIKNEGEVKVQLSENQLVISDNGSGISEEAKSKLFTPFFSTKPTGQGVGLTMIREILHNHGFAFELDSENGETSFKIRW